MPRIFKKRQSGDVYPVSRYYRGYIPFEARRDLDQKDRVDPKIEPGQLKAFEELLNEFQREGIRVIFIQIPDYIPGRDSATIEKNMSLIRKIAEARKIPFFNYQADKATEINYTRAYYVDWAHLNGRGSEAFSTLLRNDFEDQGLLKLRPKAHEG